MNKKEINVTKEELYDYYITQNHTWIQTVKDLNIPESFLRHCCNTYDWHKNNPTHNKRIKESRTTKIDVDKLYELYIIQNLTRREVCDILNIKTTVFKRVCKENGIKKDLDKIIENTNKEFYRQFGTEDFGKFSNLPNVKEKRRKTVIERLGVPNPTQAESVKRKLRIANLRDRSPIKSNLGLSVERVDEIVSSKENFINFVIQNKFDTVRNIADALGYSVSPILDFIKKYECVDMIKKQTSAGEREVLKYIKSLGIKCKHNIRNIIPPQEIDIYCPDFKIGIEFNGNYWHSVDLRGKTYHLEKYNKAKEKGVFIYHLYENEWIENKEKIKQDLKNLFTKNIVLTKKQYWCENGKIPEYIFEENGYVCDKERKPKSFTYDGCTVYNAGYKHWIKQ